MIIYLLLFVFALSQLDYIRVTRSRYEVLKCRYFLYSLRDELRELTVRGDVDSDEKAFKYMDTTIARYIDFLPQVSIYKAIALYVQYRNDQRLRIAIEQISIEFNKEKNIKVKEIHNKFLERTSLYFKEKHYILNQFALFIIVLIGLSNVFKKYIQKVASITAECPDSSTILRFGLPT